MLDACRQFASQAKRFAGKCRLLKDFEGGGMSILRLGAVAAALVLSVAVHRNAQAANISANCNSSPTTALGTAIAGANSGDVVQITGICTQDVLVTTSGITITNQSGPNTTLNPGDGVEGQLEVSGATGVTINGIALGSASTFTFGSTNDLALLYVHDGAAVTADSVTIENSPLLGVLVARASKIAFTSANTVGPNGGNTGDTFARDNGGIQARDNASVILGTSDGTGSVTLQNHTFDAVSAYRNSSVIVYHATFSGNTAHQLMVTGSSTAYITSSSSQIVAPGGATTAIQATGTSTLQIDNGAEITGASGQEAISLIGGSALLLQGSSVASAGAGPVIEASSGSVLALAGGNNICAGTLSGATCTASGGTALQIQSTIDLGQGLVSSNPSMNWSTGASGISVAQNSSVRFQGGVTVTGTLSISQGSNGFFNKTKGGSNAVTSVVCPFTTVPAAHIVAGTSGSPAVTPFPNPSTVFATTSKALQQCLAF
jgi:hypothetical protein